MASPTLVDQLAQMCGIPASFKGPDGQAVAIEDQHRLHPMRYMGSKVDSDKEIKQSIAARQAALWKEILPTVSVLHQGSPWKLDVRLKEKELPEQLKLIIHLESGEKLDIFCPVNDLDIQERVTFKKEKRVKLAFHLPEFIPLGYHSVELKLKNKKSVCSLIIAPETCYEPEALAQGKKIWGSGIQLYSVRSEKNWGMGDYRDLSLLIEKMAENGADFIGLNPVHALYQNNSLHRSPYSPSSRTYSNALYINPELMPEFSECQEAQALMNSEAFQARLKDAQQQDYVDYAATASMKYQVLELLYEHFVDAHLAKGTERGRAFKAFCKEQGEELRRFAAFDTLFEHFRKQDEMSWGWPCWPKAYQKPDSKEVKAFIKENDQRVRYFEFLQWLSREQFAIAQKTANEKGMLVGVYRDLAVGVDRGGADVWSDPELYCLQASTGAPPDNLGPLGQNWGLPPFNPQALGKKAYKPFIRMIQNNMRDCGALRIDHVMGLFRLWWCPEGQGPAAGAYVHYPLQDLLGIIKLESVSAQLSGVWRRSWCGARGNHSGAATGKTVFEHQRNT